MVTSTKSGLQRPWVEFVLGIGMIIKGIDRALPKMSLGERNKIRITPTYAYGINDLLKFFFIFFYLFLFLILFSKGPTGLPPHIPPDSKMQKFLWSSQKIIPMVILGDKVCFLIF